MKYNLKARLLSTVLSAAMLLTSPVAMLKASAEEKPKYISEVFIAYGKTEDEAKNWLTSNGWEPVEGDLNAGKLSSFDDNDDDRIVAVMGIKRTSNPEEAVTDMAVMNMGDEGNMGYSFDDYKGILNEKKAEINEFVDCFLPVLREYRDNYNGKGSEGGKVRAQLAHDLLNKFYDGEIDGAYAVNDTGKPLGDLFLSQTRREFGEDKYDKLDKNERVKYGDIQQIVLESTGAALVVVEQALTFAADAGEDSWLDRLAEMSGMSTSELAELYADGDSSLSDSAAESLLQSKYGDAASEMAKQYATIQQYLNWYLTYQEKNGLVQGEDESDDDYSARVDAFFEALKAEDEALYEDTLKKYTDYEMLYVSLSSFSYEGEWGETLYDFFKPENGTNYGDGNTYFLPFAAALSEGQRAGIEFLSLYALLLYGVEDADALRNMLPDVNDFVKDAESISIYSGINRAIFRDGVALTSRTMMEKSRGNSPYDKLWDQRGWLAISTHAAAVISIIMVAVGARLVARASKEVVAKAKKTMDSSKNWYNTIRQKGSGFSLDEIGRAKDEWAVTEDSYNSLVHGKTVGKWLLGIGGALLIAAAVMETVELYMYYDRDFTPIPLYIVDEADIVTYVTDQNGNTVYDNSGKPKRNIEFNQFLYYEVVKCNRQAFDPNGEKHDQQDGVEEYVAWGCGDAADLNCDCGKQWLALYTVKSPAKGNPILADSLTYQTGKSDMPADCTKALHFFSYTNAADIGDAAYAFNNDMNGVYLFWKDDAKAYHAASAFTSSHLALAGIGGLAAGILGTTILMTLRKKRETPADPTAA